MPIARPVLKRLHSPDAYDLHTFQPTDPKAFGILVQAMFGPENSEGEESFDIVVCTPAWLERQLKANGIIDARHHLIVGEFDLPRLQRFLTEYGNQCAAETWGEMALKLSRLGKWEFEDYRP